MKCTLCHRRLRKATLTTTGGPDGSLLHYGPICAQSVMVKPARGDRPAKLPATLQPRQRKSRAPRVPAHSTHHPDQLLLALT